MTASCVACTRAGRPVRMSSLAELDAHAATYPTHGMNPNPKKELPR